MRPERIRMWQAAELLVAEIDELMPRAKWQAMNSADHLERAAESVLFNISEGVAAYQPRVKIAAYEIAKKEANEVRAILRRLIIKKLLTDREIERAYGLAGAIIGMLTKAIIRLSSRA
jgi:four helix bundle protein